MAHHQHNNNNNNNNNINNNHSNYHSNQNQNNHNHEHQSPATPIPSTQLLGSPITINPTITSTTPPKQDYLHTDYYSDGNLLLLLAGRDPEPPLIMLTDEDQNHDDSGPPLRRLSSSRIAVTISNESVSPVVSQYNNDEEDDDDFYSSCFYNDENDNELARELYEWGLGDNPDHHHHHHHHLGDSSWMQISQDAGTLISETEAMAIKQRDPEDWRPVPTLSVSSKNKDPSLATSFSPGQFSSGALAIPDVQTTTAISKVSSCSSTSSSSSSSNSSSTAVGSITKTSTINSHHHNPNPNHNHRHHHHHHHHKFKHGHQNHHGLTSAQTPAVSGRRKQAVSRRPGDLWGLLRGASTTSTTSITSTPGIAETDTGTGAFPPPPQSRRESGSEVKTRPFVSTGGK
ncbi:uncharacterized protein SAPINGB_P000660 [Magnusiomyces paraingens]|uniref:Uncharacterized protein n=1 Tax=Magnusiomyces paraingens TaxID=2606893 RepID=A0A5E8B1L8_9ASCO|nr:uncharacterized protein SAPINGB_P000660 [Saprochaete ingens]VVT45168.1 unnamed protein product [Saprochaete ingens]